MENQPNHHYIGFPLPEGKHITVCTMDKITPCGSIIPARAISEVFRTVTRQKQSVSLAPENTSGFVPSPGTVIEVKMPQDLYNRSMILRNALYCNSSSQNGPPDYRPHISFKTVEEANSYREQYPTLDINEIDLINAKTKTTAFKLNWLSNERSFHPEYRSFLERMYPTFNMASLSFT